MKKATTERAKIKGRVKTALYNNDDLMRILARYVDNPAVQFDKNMEFTKHVFDHLFVDGTLEKAGSYIFFDVFLPVIGTNTMDVKIEMYVITHRSMLDDKSININPRYVGNISDIITEIVDETLMDKTVAKDIGIGGFSLDSVDIYNSPDYYGTVISYGANSFN